jgi:hypothetical protein
MIISKYISEKILSEIYPFLIRDIPNILKKNIYITLM